MNATPDMLEVDNPDCLIPADAVEITQERHAELFAGQAMGKQISSGEDGYPLLIGPPPPSPEDLAAIERGWRGGLLAATDGLVSRHRDELEGGSTTLTPAQYTELQAYRFALRKWPDAGGFPLIEHRPSAPDWIATLIQ
nr:phage tail protein [Pseudomonas sp. OV226]